jgi:hypothetical protein
LGKGNRGELKKGGKEKKEGKKESERRRVKEGE